MTDPFQHPVFREAIADLQSLGLRVTAQVAPGAKPYAVVGGRSNARWWLIPLHHARVTASGLALFQPLLTSAYLMKTAVVGLSLLGLSRLWARQRVYIAGESILGEHFPATESPIYAYFTGTDSPHRKVVVQIMDDRGNLKGFAKFTRSPPIAELLMHEAATLRRMQALDLHSAHIPMVLFAGQHGDNTLLITDTLKTAYTPSTVRFTAVHQAFLEELARKTAQPQRLAGEVAASLAARVERMRPQLDGAWRQRLDAAVTALAAHPALPLPAGFSHGDFTPWNTFIIKGRLYVFDWEYAEDAVPPSNDIIHFVLNEQQYRSQPVSQKLAAAMARLAQPWAGIAQEAIPALLFIYLLTQVFRQIERLPLEKRQASDWDGAAAQAGMLDELLGTILSPS